MTEHRPYVRYYGDNYVTPGHRAECTCGWRDTTTYPVGYLDNARAALHSHQEAHQ